MAQPLVIGLPPDLDLSSGYVIRVTALDPTTGNEVSGVTVSNVTFEVEPISGDFGPQQSVLLTYENPTG